MRWITRLVVLVLSASVGASSWHLLAQRKSETILLNQNVREMPAVETNISETSEAQQDEVVPSIKFGPVGSMVGYINAETVILRESPNATAPVVAKLKLGEYNSPEILGSTRDSLHVRFAALSEPDGDEKRDRDYEGWTDWGSVTPDTSAIILDAETGAVISRLALGSGIAAVTYSPDGERVVFYGAYDNSIIGYEVRTSDYTIKRSFTSATLHDNGSIFYSPSDGALYAAILSRGQDDDETTPTKLSIVRVNDEGASSVRAEISVDAEDFTVAPDGLTGFILRREDRQRNEMTVDVVDLHTFKIRNSFILRGTSLPQVASVFVVNRDGSELYERLGDDDSVSVIDTRTGQLARVLFFNSKTKDYWYFDQGDLIGDSLLVRLWNQDEDEIRTPPHTVWLGSSGRLAAEKGISYAAQVGDARYAVNERGTRLFKLDANNHIRARLNIERPELSKEADAEDGLRIFSLSASPDGKRLVMIVGIADGC